MKKSKKNKVNYNFPKETCELIAERDGNEWIVNTFSDKFF